MIAAISGKQMSICEHSTFKRVKDLVDQFEDQELGEVDIKDCDNDDLEFHSVSRNVSLKDKNGIDSDLNNLNDQLRAKFETIDEDEQKLAEQEIRKSHEALAELEKQVNDELKASNESIKAELRKSYEILPKPPSASTSESTKSREATPHPSVQNSPNAERKFEQPNAETSKVCSEISTEFSKTEEEQTSSNGHGAKISNLTEKKLTVLCVFLHLCLHRDIFKARYAKKK